MTSRPLVSTSYLLVNYVVTNFEAPRYLGKIDILLVAMEQG
jgi:hypothetical protein